MITKVKGPLHDKNGHYFSCTIAYKHVEHHLLVDADDYFAFVHGKNWCVKNSSPRLRTDKFYCKMNVGPRSSRKTILLHRLITGTLPGVVVDHEDSNGFNCRRYNLKPTTQADNATRQKHAIRRKI